MTDKARDPSDSLTFALAEAMAHPVRAKIMFFISEVEEAVGAKTISAQIEEPVRSVRHHLRRLADLGLIEVGEFRSRRGVGEKLYRPKVAPRLDDREFAELDPDRVRSITLEIFRRIFADVSRAFATGLFELRPGYCNIRVVVPVDERGWRRIGEIYRRGFEAIETARAAAGERLAESGEEPIAATAALLWFGMSAPPYGLSPIARRPAPARLPAPGVDPSVEAMAASIAHPVRGRLFALLSDESWLSARQLSEATGVPIRSVHYHLRRLLDEGVIDALGPRQGLDRTRVGLVAVPVIRDADFAAMSPARQRTIDLAVVRKLVVDATRSIAGGDFSRRSDFCEVRVPASVDQEGWSEIAAIFVRTWEAIDLERAAARLRLDRSGGKEIRATAALLWFGVPPRALA